MLSAPGPIKVFAAAVKLYELRHTSKTPCRSTTVTALLVTDTEILCLVPSLLSAATRYSTMHGTPYKGGAIVNWNLSRSTGSTVRLGELGRPIMELKQNFEQYRLGQY